TQPQGDADPDGRRPPRLPPPPGADLTQRQRRPVHRPGARRPEPPDRAPPVPEHAQPQPAQGPRHRPAVLPGPGRRLRGNGPGRLLPVGTHQPPRRRRPAPTDPRPHLAGRGAAVGTAASRTQPSASAVPGAPALAAVVGDRGPSAYRRPFVGLPVWCDDTAAAVVEGGTSAPVLRVQPVDEERA